MICNDHKLIFKNSVTLVYYPAILPLENTFPYPKICYQGVCKITNQSLGETEEKNNCIIDEIFNHKILNPRFVSIYSNNYYFYYQYLGRDLGIFETIEKFRDFTIIFDNLLKINNSGYSHTDVKSTNILLLTDNCNCNLKYNYNLIDFGLLTKYGECTNVFKNIYYVWPPEIILLTDITEKEQKLFEQLIEIYSQKYSSDKHVTTHGLLKIKYFYKETIVNMIKNYKNINKKDISEKIDVFSLGLVLHNIIPYRTDKLWNLIDYNLFRCLINDMTCLDFAKRITLEIARVRYIKLFTDKK